MAALGTLNEPVRAALVVAHPAHEIRVHGWLGRTRAAAFVLTCGARSGTQTDRYQASAAIVRDAGGEWEAQWGGALDKDVYAYVREGDAAPFQAWTASLSEEFVRRRIEVAVIDSWQYYNVAHDLTHLMARLAVKNAEAKLGRPIRCVNYQVSPKALAPCSPQTPVLASLQLSASEAAAKRAAMLRMPGVEAEMAELNALEGADWPLEEVFYAPPPLALLIADPSEKPAYEIYGEKRVAAGIYKDVLRWTHVSRIVQALVARQPTLSLA